MKIKLMENKAPKILISNSAMNKMKAFVDGKDKEIGWLGTVIREGMQYFIEDVYLFKQEVHSTTTEITPEGLSEFAMELMNTENGVEIWNNMKLWGHSHVNMGVNPSGQDDKQVETFESCGYDFFIRIICNKQRQVRLDLYDYETGIIYQELEYSIYYTDEQAKMIDMINAKIKSLQKALDDKLSLNNEEKEAIKSEIKEKVTDKAYTYTNKYGGYNKYNGYGMSNYSNWWDEQRKIEDNFSKKNEISEMEEEIEEEIEKAINIFDDFSASETFEGYMHIESGGDIREILRQEVSRGVAFELEELICDYVITHDEQYQEYIKETYGGII